MTRWLFIVLLWSFQALAMGYLLDGLAWELSYDIMLPAEEGLRIAGRYAFTIATILGLVATAGNYVQISWYRLLFIMASGVIIAWLLLSVWVSLALAFPAALEPIPSETLASPRRYIVMMSFRRIMHYTLAISGLLTLISLVHSRWRTANLNLRE